MNVSQNTHTYTNKKLIFFTIKPNLAMFTSIFSKDFDDLGSDRSIFIRFGQFLFDF